MKDDYGIGTGRSGLNQEPLEIVSHTRNRAEIKATG